MAAAEPLLPVPTETVTQAVAGRGRAMEPSAPLALQPRPRWVRWLALSAVTPLLAAEEILVDNDE
eukprot:3852277-Alexandrium_andersonii.AAC.1